MLSFHIATPSTQCDIQRHKRYLRNYELVTWQSFTSAAAPPPGASVQSPHLWCWSLTGTFSARTKVVCFKMCLIQIHWCQVKPEWHHVSVLLAWLSLGLISVKGISPWWEVWMGPMFRALLQRHGRLYCVSDFSDESCKVSAAVILLFQKYFTFMRFYNKCVLNHVLVLKYMFVGARR